MCSGQAIEGRRRSARSQVETTGKVASEVGSRARRANAERRGTRDCELRTGDRVRVSGNELYLSFERQRGVGESEYGISDIIIHTAVVCRYCFVCTDMNTISENPVRILSVRHVAPLDTGACRLTWVGNLGNT